MDFREDVVPAKASFNVGEEVQNNILKRRGIACSVFFEGEQVLLTSSSAVGATDNQKKLIAERFSSSHNHRLDVSFYRQLGNFTFLKIDKEYNDDTTGRNWLISLNLEAPSDEIKELAKPFGGKSQFKLQFKCVGKNTTIEVISEGKVDRTSIIGAPIIIEKRQMKKKHSGRFSVVGVVGLTSEETLCPYYLNLSDENTQSLDCSLAPEDQQTWIQYGGMNT
ncbi:uncharacterized protein LOC122964238 isoform X2 [Acropora millepora]|uniref:uncharacterized protein LOC122964238 isoform X2 n=1 Tax=Acropora millepora TaxID=45264 RepID=UPI001CF289E5|nr:uncharacterized protein LOC122964238 isoform X2 [Acropora millepora]